jgi:hypothetical protein
MKKGGKRINLSISKTKRVSSALLKRKTENVKSQSKLYKNPMKGTFWTPKYFSLVSQLLRTLFYYLILLLDMGMTREGRSKRSVDRKKQMTDLSDFNGILYLVSAMLFHGRKAKEWTCISLINSFIFQKIKQFSSPSSTMVVNVKKSILFVTCLCSQMCRVARTCQKFPPSPPISVSLSFCLSLSLLSLHYN